MKSFYRGGAQEKASGKAVESKKLEEKRQSSSVSSPERALFVWD